MEVLVHLAERQGEVVSKEELLAALWDEDFVTEYALWRCIAQLRRALGDDSKAPVYIETRHRLGYRLLPEVVRLDAASEPASPSRASASSPGPVRRWWWGLAAGVAAVAAIASIALWPMDREERAEPSEASAPATSSELVLSGLERLERHTWSDTARAIELLERAVDLNSRSAAAHAALANAYASNWDRYAATLHDRRWVDAALEAAEHAVALDPELADAHVALGNAYSSKGHPDEAANAYRRALELEPEHPRALDRLAIASYRLGRLDQAVELETRALTGEPSNPVFASNLGSFYLLLGDLGRARRLSRRALELDGDLPAALGLAVRLELAAGNSEAAAAAGRRAIDAHPRSSWLLQLAALAEQLDGRPGNALELLRRATADSLPDGIGDAVLRLSHLLWELGDRQEAAQFHRGYGPWIADAEANEDNWRSAYWRAAIHAIRGEAEASTAWMEKAVARGFVNHWHMRRDPIFAGVVDDPGYQELVGALAARVDRMRRNATG